MTTESWTSKEEKPSTEVQLGTEVPSKRRLLWAITLGLIAAVLNFRYLNTARGNPLRLYKAKVPIAAGSYISKSEFDGPIVVYSPDLREMVQLSVNEDNFDLYAKSPLAENLKPGQVLLKSAFEYGAATGVRDQIRSGQEAVSIPVDKARSVGGAIRPGDRVNVYALRGTGGDREPLIHGALVIAVDADYLVPSDHEYTTVTISAEPEKVKDLVSLIQSGPGKVYLTMVSADVH